MNGRLNIGAAMQLLTVGLLVHLFMSLSWGLEPTKKVTQYLVDHWEESDGIPSNSIRLIRRTPDGYLWFATDKGLVRFDGVTFALVSFTGREEAGPRGRITPDTLYADGDGTLWIGSAGGLTSYHHQTGKFTTYTAADGLIDDRIRLIREDMRGNLWISFYSSYVSRFTGGEFVAYNRSHGLEDKKTNAVVEDRKGNLLFGTSEKGVFRYKDEKFFAYPVPGLDGLRVNTMVEDRNGNLWIGTNNGLFKVTDAGTTVYTTGKGLSNKYITDILEDRDRNLWIGTAKGLNRLRATRDGGETVERLFTSHTILCLFEDNEKSVWVGTYDSGVKRLKDGKFASYPPLDAHPGELLFSLYRDRRGDVWIGTVSGKLFHCRGEEIIELLEPSALSGAGIAAIGEDAEGNLWLGTNGKGAVRMKNKTFAPFTTRDGLTDNQVMSIYGDSRNDLWFSTFDGVSVLRFADGVFESLDSHNGLSGKRVHNVYEDGSHNIWIAADRGITFLKEGKIEKQNMAYYLPGIPITCIYEDPSTPGDDGGIYWIATDGAGLKRLTLTGNSASTVSYTTTHGMTTDFIYRFFEDPQGNFRLMSKNGILRVSKIELNRVARGELDSINCVSYGISDGLKSDEFNNRFSRNSALKGENGELWFITRKGISIIDPGKIRVNKTPPSVVIESAFLNHRPIPRRPGSDAGIFRGKGNLRIRFSAPTFLSPEKIKFKYRLEGVDKDWLFLPPGGDRTVQYQPAPGAYTFRVTACNAEGIWNRTGASFTFELKPYFHQTVLFKIAALLIFAGLAAVAFYVFKKRPGEKNGKKEEKYKGASLEPAFVDVCVTKLMYLMDVEKVYRNENLTLRSLADKLKIPAYQLSQIINDKLERSFSDFVNFHRIEEAKKILENPNGEGTKITAMAYKVGFHSMTAFYQAFKKYTGMTPKQYREKIAKQSKQ